MSQADRLYKDYFLEYASYVVRDRAIPDLVDGFKPVQRRIMHTLFTMDDGRFVKVANVVGEAMKYHPHGDSSIYEALVNLANAELFIEKQGNYGNFLTGDGAAASRYIECRLKPFAKKVLYNPEITEFTDSYDGRRKEPVVFPAKIPVVVIQGTIGIAVGMSTMILPHNALEVLEAEKKALRGEPFEIYPDFPGGGIIDVSEYNDGLGKISVRAKLNAEDPKKLIIEELPYGVTSDSMIASIEKANATGRLKIASISDYTAEKAQIEICWQRNTYSQDMVDVLYATTDCEKKISVNPLVIVDGYPKAVPISEMIKFHAKHLVEVLRAELENDKKHLEEKLRARTLERIFIEERIYKEIETKKTAEDVKNAIILGFDPFMAEIGNEPITDDDLDKLLKIPIRRISLFDIEKNKEEIAEINAGIKKINYNLKHIIDYAEACLTEYEGMLDKDEFRRKTEISSFQTLNVRQVAVRNMDVRYDQETGYLGTSIKTGESLLKVSPFDKIFYMKQNGEYRVVTVQDKVFIGSEGLFYINYGDKELISKEIFTVIYRDKIRDKNVYQIKRFHISSFSTDKPYSVISGEKAKVKKMSLWPSAIISMKFRPGYGYKILEDTARFADFPIYKSPAAAGQRLTGKELQSLSIRQTKDASTTEEKEPSLLDGIEDDK